MFCHHAWSQYIPYCQKGKWGFATTDGKITVPCVYEAVDFYSDDKLAKVKKGRKFGYISIKGTTVIPFEYDECFRIYEVYHGEHSVGIKKNPEIHLNYDFDFDDSKNNRYIVSKNKKYGILSLVDGKPKVLVPLNYLRIQFDPGKKIFHCFTGTNTLLFNTNGQKLTQDQVNSIERIEYSSVMEPEASVKSPFIVKANGKVGAVRPPNRMSRAMMRYDTIVPIMYDDIIAEKVKDNYVPGYEVFGVKLDKKWGMVDSKKNILLPIQFDSINFELSSEFRHWAEYQRTFVVKQNSQWGILGKKDDKTDSLTALLPFEYEGVSKIYYYYLLVQKENKFQVFSLETYNLISDKSYPSITAYEHESVDDFPLFQVINKQGQPVYIGKNGVEFFTD